MKRIKYISPKVQVQIIEDYKAKNPDKSYKFTLQEIADKHEVSLSTVNNLARMAKCQGRPQGGRKLIVPDAKTMKLLRDATEVGITLDEVGRRNRRWVTLKSGRRVLKPLSKQRVSQIIAFWKKRGNPGLRTKGFKAGDKILWAEQYFTVVRYDDQHRGAVTDDKDGKLIDPFYWVHQGCRSKLVQAAPEAPAEEQPA